MPNDGAPHRGADPRREPMAESADEKITRALASIDRALASCRELLATLDETDARHVH